MITLLRLVTKAVKWSVIIAAYLVLGLAKLATILVVLLFLSARAGIRRLIDTKERRALDDEPDEYDLGYPSGASYEGRSSRSYPGVSRDAFDARWQRERDLRVAERRARETGADVWVSAGPPEVEHRT